MATPVPLAAMEGTGMFDIEISSRIADALAINGLSPDQTLWKIRQYVNGVSNDRLLKGTVAVLRDQQETIAQLETEIDYLLSEIARLGERETDLEEANQGLVVERSTLHHELEELRAQLASIHAPVSSGGQDHAARQ
jgi:DNA repair exonuclease SbcCD ATPase subunit